MLLNGNFRYLNYYNYTIYELKLVPTCLVVLSLGLSKTGFLFVSSSESDSFPKTFLEAWKTGCFLPFSASIRPYL